MLAMLETGARAAADKRLPRAAAIHDHEWDGRGLTGRHPPHGEIGPDGVGREWDGLGTRYALTVERHRRILKRPEADLLERIVGASFERRRLDVDVERTAAGGLG